MDSMKTTAPSMQMFMQMDIIIFLKKVIPC